MATKASCAGAFAGQRASASNRIRFESLKPLFIAFQTVTLNVHVRLTPRLDSASCALPTMQCTPSKLPTDLQSLQHRVYSTVNFVCKA